jgi:flagellar basal-body rod modification protein FlgD
MATSTIGDTLSSLYSATSTANSSKSSNKTATSSSTTGTSALSSASSTLGESDFLNLLCTQLKNQDPLDPMKDTEFIAQLATFSSLEQMTSMNSSMSYLLEQQYYNTNASMLGKTVTTSDGKTGVVTKVTKEDNSMYLYVGENKYSLSDVTSITATTLGDSTT